MIKEDKELLLKDLCARLPYGVKMSQPDGNLMGIYTSYSNGGPNKNIVDLVLETSYAGNNLPYLRPMSSMTEEEAMEYANCGNIITNSPQNNYLIPNHNCVDWLNAHHFDYRGLIERGLVIAVTEENNPYKE